MLGVIFSVSVCAFGVGSGKQLHFKNASWPEHDKRAALVNPPVWFGLYGNGGLRVDPWNE
jgi:hypothetical protein